MNFPRRVKEESGDRVVDDMYVCFFKSEVAKVFHTEK